MVDTNADVAVQVNDDEDTSLQRILLEQFQSSVDQSMQGEHERASMSPLHYSASRNNAAQHIPINLQDSKVDDDFVNEDGLTTAQINAIIDANAAAVAEENRRLAREAEARRAAAEERASAAEEPPGGYRGFSLSRAHNPA